MKITRKDFDKVKQRLYVTSEYVDEFNETTPKKLLVKIKYFKEDTESMENVATLYCALLDVERMKILDYNDKLSLETLPVFEVIKNNINLSQLTDNLIIVDQLKLSLPFERINDVFLLIEYVLNHLTKMELGTIVFASHAIVRNKSENTLKRYFNYFIKLGLKPFFDEESKEYYFMKELKNKKGES